MARLPDRLGVVEAIWDMELESSAWMARMASALAEAVPDLSAPTAFHAIVEDMRMRVLDAGAPGRGEHLPVVLASAAQTPPELIARTRMLGATGLLAFRHADAPETGGLVQVAPAITELGGRDVFTVGARDGRGETICLTGTTSSRRPMRSDERRAWQTVSAHLGAALRLRQRGMTGTIDDADVVFDSRGTIVHRKGWSGGEGAVDDGVIAGLRDRIRVLNGRASRRSPSWMDAVFDGEWSIVARREGDGSVCFLAIRNPVDGAPMRRLTPREVEIVHALMRDVPAKVVADELGVSEAALARASLAAFRKLGVRTRAECMLVYSALGSLGYEGTAAAAAAGEAEVESVLRVGWSVQELCVSRGMTPAEASIVPLLVAGVRDAAIAERRGVSRRTVANQTASIFRKLGLSSRFELAREMTRALEAREASEPSIA